MLSKKEPEPVPTGITIASRIAIGDSLQFSSLPENYFRATGQRLHDLSKPWFFDRNPYVLRDSQEKPEKVIEMWNYSPTQYEWPKPRDLVYLSNAEIHAGVHGVPVVLNRPRLYRFEDYPFKERSMILFHIQGRSHGEMPLHIIKHVIEKYGGENLFHIGLPSEKDYGIKRICPDNLWGLAEIVSKARMFIGIDSGPGWISCCFPDVVTKIVRTKPTAEHFKNWIPLEILNIHSHWDDRCRQVFNPTDDDIGFTYSYRRI